MISNGRIAIRDIRPLGGGAYSYYPDSFAADLLLVFPPFARPLSAMENIGIESIAAYVRAHGFSAEVLNCSLHSLSAEDVAKILRAAKIKVLGVSVLHWTIRGGFAIARAAKKIDPSVHVVMGGIGAAFYAEQILAEHPYVDSIGLGEGETILAGLCAAIRSGADWRLVRGLVYRDRKGLIIRNEPAPLLDPLDGLPLAARDDLPAVMKAGGPAVISASRGCFGMCKFCAVRSFYDLSPGKKWRGRSPRNVADELLFLRDTYGNGLFSFIDETVAGPGRGGRERLLEMAELIREACPGIKFFMNIRADQVDRHLIQALKKAGLVKMEIGLETMSAEQLRRYGKTAKVGDNIRALQILEELDICTEIFMIPFDYEVECTDLKKNWDFLRQRYQKKPRQYDNSALVMADFLYLYPGTAAATAAGNILKPGEYRPYTSSDPQMAEIQGLMKEFLGEMRSAFPNSAERPDLPFPYIGLGNLWTNSNDLPAPVYEEVCRLSTDAGKLLVAFGEWAYGNLQEAKTQSDATGAFLAQRDALAARLAVIIAEHAKEYGWQKISEKFNSRFNAQLYQLGRDIVKSRLGN